MKRMVSVILAAVMLTQIVLSLIWMIRGIILAAMGKAVSIPLVGWLTIVPYRYPGQ